MSPAEIPNKTDVSDDKIRTVELDWYEDNDIVTVTPRDQKRFDIQKDRAIEALQLVDKQDKFNLQFSLLLDCIASWINKNQDDIENTLLTLQDGVLALVVVRKTAEFNEGLEGSLLELDFQLANDPDFDLIHLNTLALPSVSNDALRSFLDERLVLSYHGNRSRPH